MVALPVIIAGTIGTYLDLVNKVGLWLDRDDLDDRIPDFVALAEAALSRELRILNQETRFSFSASGSGYAMPSDFRRMKRLWVSGNPNLPITQTTGEIGAQSYSSNPGCPRSYYIENRSIYFLPPLDAAYDFDCTYVARIMPLTSSNQSNWLLAEHPDAYLFGTMLEAAVYIRDQDAISYLQDRFATTIAAINAAARRDAWGHGPIVPQSPRQVRGARC